jgi:hypothetical protein
MIFRSGVNRGSKAIVAVRRVRSSGEQRMNSIFYMGLQSSWSLYAWFIPTGVKPVFGKCTLGMRRLQVDCRTC